VIVIPTVLMITSLAESASAMIDKMAANALHPGQHPHARPIIGDAAQRQDIVRPGCQGGDQSVS
jgi:hypothetical protein